jgi:hypothetical protein
LLPILYHPFCTYKYFKKDGVCAARACIHGTFDKTLFLTGQNYYERIAHENKAYLLRLLSMLFAEN